MNPFVLMKAKKILTLISLIATLLSTAIGIYENTISLRSMATNRRAA